MHLLLQIFLRISQGSLQKESTLTFMKMLFLKKIVFTRDVPGYAGHSKYQKLLLISRGKYFAESGRLCLGHFWSAPGQNSWFLVERP